MKSSRPILVATDFSPSARHATDRAARVAHEKGAPLALLHVMPGEALASLRQWLGASNAPEVQIMASAREQLEQLATELRASRNVEPTRNVTAGPPVDEVVREAERLDARLIVLGARGTGFLRRLVLGTTAERLLRRTVRPLLVVRQTPHEPYRRVLVALDFSVWSAHSIALARRVAPRAHLLLFNAYQVPFEDKLKFAGVDAATIDQYRRHARADATQRVHAMAAASGLTPSDWEPCIVEGEASLRIIEHEQEKDCDLIVLGKHGQSATEDLLLGSVTKHVLAEGSTDVLVSTAREP
ncbi:MAG: universal stress protein [Burkholderiaceae bacterium]|jgi:nucleotide-binding universal stress UspA family protein|nr:universal stress protein [Burkholderiaceae bacterium]